MISDVKIADIATDVAELYQAIKTDNGGEFPVGSLPAITMSVDVTDRLTGLLFSVQKIGAMLDTIGGQPLVHKVIVAVEEMLDDVNAHVFLNRRWDGFPRS